ncbi:MAG: chorismate mutase [bacterium]
MKILSRSIRGATTVNKDDKSEILAATKELLSEIVKTNQIKIDDISSIIFTVTDDLTAAFPAEAARELGWNDTPLLCSKEISVPGSLGKCIRVLLTVNTDKSPQEIKHLYLKEAVALRK